MGEKILLVCITKLYGRSFWSIDLLWQSPKLEFKTKIFEEKAVDSAQIHG